MKSRREQMREWRRQSDPSFPAAVKSRPSKPPPPRPSEPPPSRPTEPPPSRPVVSSASRPSEPPPSRPLDPASSSNPGQGVLKGHKGRNRRKNKKGLRVSFDLENTQEVVVPPKAEEAVVECWEDLSDGDAVGLSCDNPSKDDNDDLPSVHDWTARLNEDPDALEGVTYFGISESREDEAVDGLDDAPDVQRSYEELENEFGEEVTDVPQGGIVSDLDGKGPTDTALGITMASNVGYPQESSDESLLEGLTDVSLPDEMNEASHLEGLTEVTHPDETNDMSYESVDLSHDGLKCTGRSTDVRETEKPTNTAHLDEVKDGNDSEVLEVSAAELSGESHLEGLTDVVLPEEMHDVSHLLEKLTNLSDPSEVTDTTYPELTDINNSKEVTDVNHVEGLTDLSHLEEPTDKSNFEEVTDASNSVDIICVSHLESTDASHSDERPGASNQKIISDASRLGLTVMSHSELTDVSQSDNLTESGHPDELNSEHYDGVSSTEELTDVIQANKLAKETFSEEVNNSNGTEVLSDSNPDKSPEPSRNSLTDMALTRQQEEELSVASDSETKVAESYAETPAPDHEESISSPDSGAEGDSNSARPATVPIGELEEKRPAPPPISEADENPVEGTADDDDDEWETEPSGESEEASENTWEATGCDGSTGVVQRPPDDDSGEDSDSLILNDDIEAVLLALMEDQEKGMPSLVSCGDQPQEENHVPAPGTHLVEQDKRAEREKSPQVTIGYECRDRKSASVYGSETESEGELVPCEDKCVGTADRSDDEPLEVPHEDGVNQNKMADCQEGALSLDASKHTTLAAPDVQIGVLSPSPEIPEIPEEGKCIGNSESGKEKDKANGKKVVKKKGKKNKREVKAEPVVVPAEVVDRPKLVRGRAWKEKREKINAKRLLNLSFGSEICESEVVEGTSNLLTETYTETSLLTPTRCPLGTTVFTETPCTACSSVSGEFSESDSLHADCKCGEQRPEDAGVVALVAEVKTCDEAPELAPKPSQAPTAELTPEPVTEPASKLTPELTEEFAPESSSKPISELVHTLAPPTVTVKVTGASDEEDNRADDACLPAGDTSEFFIVRTQTVAAPSQVLTEYVEDSESEEDSKPQDDEEDSTNVTSPKGSVYIDAVGSACTDTLDESFDYDKSFPNVLGTQQLSLIYSYDSGPDTDAESGQGSIEGGGRTPDSAGESDRERIVSGDAIYTAGWGKIIYEGPCLCGDVEVAKEHKTPARVVERVSGTERAGDEEQLCIPAVRVSDAVGVVAGDGNEAREEASVSEPPTHAMGSNQEEQSSEGVNNAKDIRLRINEIVGGRLLRDRGRGVSPGVREEVVCLEEQHGGREDSPLPGSSPASSSGVQGSDEMSLSRSRSRSPSREKSVSPSYSPHGVSENPTEPRPSQAPSQDRYEREALESLLALRYEGSIDSTPEKSVPVDCSFRTFREMYQINPIYLTDSDDHDDLNESDTVVPVTASVDYDPERSITVTSWSSTSDCSPDLPELRPSPPLPGTHATKKVPKVTKLLRETQGIVQRWEVLQAQAVERQRQSSQVRELQRQVKNLRLSLEALGEQASELTKADDVDNRLKLIQKLQEAKALQQEVSSRKSEVSSINLAVHRFLTESGYALANLKDDVADLYRLWDEADRRVNSEVSRLENVDTTWKLWESQAEELTKMLRQDGDTLKVLDEAIQTGSMTDTATASMQGVARLLNDKRKTQPGKKLLLQHTKTQSVDIQASSLSLAASGDECLSDSGTSGYESCSSEELSERERRLANLRRLARDLEASLHPNSQAWASICKTLSSAEAELKGLQQHCRELVVRSSETLDQAKTSPQLRRRMWSKDCKVGKTSRRANNVSGSGRNGNRRGWVWRVVRAALPFQAALLLLFCVACLLEPNCCDHVNTLNLSLSPQLRYVHGPPPV